MIHDMVRARARGVPPSVCASHTPSPLCTTAFRHLLRALFVVDNQRDPRRVHGWHVLLARVPVDVPLPRNRRCFCRYFRAVKIVLKSTLAKNSTSAAK